MREMWGKPSTRFYVNALVCLLFLVCVFYSDFVVFGVVDFNDLFGFGCADLQWCGFESH
jgi:hypothetical protein